MYDYRLLIIRILMKIELIDNIYNEDNLSELDDTVIIKNIIKKRTINDIINKICKEKFGFIIKDINNLDTNENNKNTTTNKKSKKQKKKKRRNDRNEIKTDKYIIESTEKFINNKNENRDYINIIDFCIDNELIINKIFNRDNIQSIYFTKIPDLFYKISGKENKINKIQLDNFFISKDFEEIKKYSKILFKDKQYIDFYLFLNIFNDIL